MWLGCIVTGLDTFTFLAVHYLGVRSSFFFWSGQGLSPLPSFPRCHAPLFLDLS